MSSAEPQSHPSPAEPEPTNRAISVLLPLFLAAASAPPQDQNAATLFINTFTGSLIVISGSSNSDRLIKEGPPPASEAAIRALPAVKVEEVGLECAICLEEYEVGEEAKEMTCKHRFHPGCIEKWLRVNGSCPVCRHRMPEEEGDGESRKGEEREGREMRIRFVDGEMVIDEVDI